MFAVVTRGHVRRMMEDQRFHDMIAKLDDTHVYVNAWDRYETAFSWKPRNSSSVSHELTRDTLQAYFADIGHVRNVTIYSSPTLPASKCRVWNCPCDNHLNTFSNMRRLYDLIDPSYRRIVSIRNDVLSIGLRILPRTLRDAHLFLRHIRTHIFEYSDPIAFAMGGCHSTVGNDAVISGTRAHLMAHAEHRLSRWNSSLIEEYSFLCPHHEYLVIEMAREIALCPGDSLRKGKSTEWECYQRGHSWHQRFFSKKAP